MYQADNALGRGRGWAVGAWTILVFATVLGLLSSQASQLIGERFPFGGRVLGSNASAAESPLRLQVARHADLPIILTVPVALTRTQRTIVARMKQDGELDAHPGRVRSALGSARGLLAGLALIGAAQPQGH